MKSIIKYSLVCLVSLACGIYIGWRIFWNQIESRVVPFDKSKYDSFCIDFIMHEPWMTVQMEGTNRIYRTSNPNHFKPVDYALGNTFKRMASISKEFPIVVSFNAGYSINDIQDFETMIEKSGLAMSKCLVEDLQSAKGNRNERLFQEIRIGPLKPYGWYQREWFIESEQERVNNTKAQQKDGVYKN